MSTHPAPRRNSRFNKAAEKRNCYGERCRHELLQVAVQKQDGHGGLLFTPDSLKAALTTENMREMLGCKCALCLPHHEDIDPHTNQTFAQAISNNEGTTRLLAALCLMGCAFAFRPLYSSRLQNMNEVKSMLEAARLKKLPLEAREKIQNSLNSLAATNTFPCNHEPTHSNNSPECLFQSFHDRFLEKRTLLDTPTFIQFEPDAMLKRVHDEVNLPFIREISIPSHTTPSHSFYRFDLCTAFIQGHENNQESETPTLFRKEIRLSEGTQEGRTNDQDVLNYMARQNHSSIAKLLFAYTHERDNAKFDNLIFEYYPLDLQKVITGSSTFSSNSTIRKNEEESYAEFNKAIKSSSLADHPAWLGMLGVLEAVKGLHNAPRPLNNESGLVIGGHFDIKPANILVDIQKDMRFVLTDFGQAKLRLLIDEGSTGITGAPGTPSYQPPDRLDGTKKLDRMYDIWSLACVLTEVLVFIKTQDVVQFRQARLHEQTDDRYQVADFWRYESREIRKPCLKTAVEARLADLAKYEDTKRYVGIIKDMFTNVLNGVRNGIDFYLQELKSPNGIDESFFLDHEAPIGDENTACAISELEIKISRRKGEIDGRILLNSEHDRRNAFSLALIGTIKIQRTVPGRENSKSGMEEKALVCSDTLDIETEQVIPYSMCDYEISHGQCRIGFRYGHKGSHIIFALQKDMDMLLGAITRHYPRPGSTFYHVSCTVETAGPAWSSAPKTYKLGSLHILQRLDSTRYKELFVNPQTDLTTTRSGGSTKIAFRLLFYGRNADFRRCLIIELGEVVVSTQKDDSDTKKSIIRGSEDQKFRLGTIKATQKIDEFPARIPDPACYPGIPLKADGLKNVISSGKTVSRLILEFKDSQDRSDFEKICRNLFLRNKVARPGSVKSEF